MFYENKFEKLSKKSKLKFYRCKESIFFNYMNRFSANYKYYVLKIHFYLTIFENEKPQIIFLFMKTINKKKKKN